VLFIHHAAVYLLPHPLNNINIIFIAVILFMIKRETGLSVWLACILHFFIELYSITPFGLILFPGVISAVFAYILYANVFTNKSWYSAVALTVSALIIYRLLYTIIFWLVEFSAGRSGSIRSFLLINYMWELALTGVVVGAAVYLLSKVMPRFKTEKILI